MKRNIAFILMLQLLITSSLWARKAGEGAQQMNRSQDVFDGRGENKFNQELQDQDRLKEHQRVQKQEADLKKDRLKKRTHQKTP